MNNTGVVVVLPIFTITAENVVWETLTETL